MKSLLPFLFLAASCPPIPIPSPSPTSTPPVTTLPSPIPTCAPCPSIEPAPGPVCPLEGQTLDPKTWCGCYDWVMMDTPTLTGKWIFAGSCSTPSPEPTPTPTPTPSTLKCPPFSSVTGRLFVCLDKNFNISKNPDGSPKPVVNGHCTVDTTQRFGGHQPCDSDHPCPPPNGRTDCADPRGQSWTWSVPSDKCNVQAPGDGGTGYQLECKKLRSGKATWKACIQHDAKDGRGEPFRYDGNAKKCVEGTYNVQ